MTDELNNQMPTAPLEQMSPDMSSEQMPQTGPTSEEILPTGPMHGETIPTGEAPMDEQSMRSDIERNLADVNNQNNALETKKFIAKNKIKNFKIEMLRDIYAMLQKLGVDASNPESIKNFLASLEQQDPDLLTLFETIFDTLSPDNKTAFDELSTPVEQMPPSNAPSGPNLMDKYSNLQEQVLR
jgi:hypothetical protein